MKAKQKLWQIDDTLHPLIEAYTVGEDYLLDQKLIPYDIMASKAHAKMLAEMNILTTAETDTLADALGALQIQWETGNFQITQAQEDCHTAIEQYLTTTCGELGKKIHTGRSRNDQVLVMLRLFEKAKLQEILEHLRMTSSAFATEAERYNKQPMPGYTHMQRAMPTTVGMWLGSYADAFLDSMLAVQAVLQLIDQNPLGSASGFGIQTFPLKRDTTTYELGFTKTQDNPMYCGLSRGIFEAQILHALSMPMVIASRFAADMLLFTTEEYNFVSLPSHFTTGSSIMPNKKNYDLFEIMRANASIFNGYQQQVQQIVSGLSSGYSRDLQLTKQPILSGLELVSHTLSVLTEVVPHVHIHSEPLARAMSPDLFATNQVYDLVQQGVAFRDAYTTIKQELRKKKSDEETGQ